MAEGVDHLTVERRNIEIVHDIILKEMERGLYRLAFDLVLARDMTAQQ
jgi:hypothetical protein